jgi:ABC-type transporter Mla MlaB component
MSLDPQVHEPFRCELEPERDRVRVRPIGEIDMGTVPVLEAHLAQIKAAGFSLQLVAGPPTVQRLFDLTHTTERLSFIGR